MPAPDPSELRAAMAHLPTGVTVVTAAGAEGPAGATANAVSSLSLEPPLLLACLDRGSRTLRAVEQAGRFGVSVLGAGQEQLARAFSTKAPHPEKWREVPWRERAGSPAIEGCLLWVGCELDDVIGGGDHVIVTGAVLEAEADQAAGEPLVFWHGRYLPLREATA